MAPAVDKEGPTSDSIQISPRARRHEIYYSDSVIFKVEDTLYKVPINPLRNLSEVFDNMLLIGHQTTQANSTGSDMASEGVEDPPDGEANPHDGYPACSPSAQLALSRMSFIQDHGHARYYLLMVIYYFVTRLLGVALDKGDLLSGPTDSRRQINHPATSDVIEGQTDEQPIVLASELGYRSRDFESLLNVLFPQSTAISLPQIGTVRSDAMSKEEWIGVLKLSTMWEMKNLRAVAIRKLSGIGDGCSLSPTDKITLSREYRVSIWFSEGLADLADKLSKQVNGVIPSTSGTPDEEIQRLAGLVGWETIARVLWISNTLNHGFGRNITFNQEPVSVIGSPHSYLEPQLPSRTPTPPTPSQWPINIPHIESYRNASMVSAPPIRRSSGIGAIEAVRTLFGDELRGMETYEQEMEL